MDACLPEGLDQCTDFVQGFRASLYGLNGCVNELIASGNGLNQ